jgi:DNA-binding transcriptional LysR family regulator
MACCSTRRRARGVSLRLRIQVRSFEAICRMIHTGMGVGVLPNLAVRTYLPALDVRVIPLHDPWARRELKVAVRNQDNLSLTAKQMLDHLRSSPSIEDISALPS